MWILWVPECCEFWWEEWGWFYKKYLSVLSGQNNNLNKGLNLLGFSWFFKITTLSFTEGLENGPKIQEYLGIHGFPFPDSLQKPFGLSFKFCGLSFKLAFVKQLRLRFKLGNLKDVSTTVNYERMKWILKLQNVGYALTGIILKVLALIESKNKVKS